MNERLKKIAVEAMIQMVSEPRLVKFNELIIEDCIRNLRNNGYDDAAQHLHDVHFGIDDAP
jgi:hypothetical protein